MESLRVLTEVASGYDKPFFLAGDMNDEPGSRFTTELQKNFRLLSNPRYWEMLKVVWIAVGSTSVVDEFRRYMRSTRPCRNYFMTPEEHEALRNMQFPLKVWRACNSEDDGGLSWTVSMEVAVEFAARGNCRKILVREVDRKDVFAYINRRGEDEIIIL